MGGGDLFITKEYKMPTAQEKANQSLFRTKTTVEYVREEVQRDGKTIIIRADLPVGRGWNDGTAIAWNNLGWQSASEYDAKKHKAMVDEEQKNAAIKAEVERQLAEVKAKEVAEAKAESKKVK
jgi:hypothetical protein